MNLAVGQWLYEKPELLPQNYIFATWLCKPSIFHTLKYISSRIQILNIKGLQFLAAAKIKGSSLWQV